MRLLILNYEYPPLGGGMGVVSRFHAEGLSREGHKVTVLTTWFQGEKEIAQEGNLQIIKLKSKRRYTYKSTPDEWISWIRASKKFLKKHLVEHTYDMCMAHFALPAGEVAAFAKRKFHLPYVVISHGQDIPWFFPKQMFKYHLFTYFWIKKICRNSEKLILLTQAMKKNADRFMGKYKDQNTIIPNGFESKEFYPDYSLKKKTFTLLFVGRLVAQKDPFTFLKALKILAKAELPFKAHIAGDGPLRKKMENFVRQHRLAEYVTFKGWLSKKEMLHEYQSASLQVISSKAEAMSIAALESLACGQFIISTPVSGNTDMIREGINGSFFKYSDAETLAQKIKAFYTDYFLQDYRLSESDIRDFKQKFDWKHIISLLQKELLVLSSKEEKEQ
ncbi:MAG: hypothetical protein CSB06_03840 [Bacteroidia bacterium]|nr:MAG: hypothetical protein CSB06_03840 [Bacteroidia bacterium]